MVPTSEMLSSLFVTTESNITEWQQSNCATLQVKLKLLA